MLPSSQSHQLIAIRARPGDEQACQSESRVSIDKNGSMCGIKCSVASDAISWGMLESRVSDISDASAKSFSHRLFDADLQIYKPEHGSYDRVSDDISLRSTK